MAHRRQAGSHTDRTALRFNELRNAKYSNQWQSKPDTWLAQSRDFLCKPADRQARKMERLGVMPASQIAKAGPQLFEILNREAAKAAIMQKIDEGSCQIDVFINRARLVQKVRTKGRCAVVEMAPAARV